MRQVLTVFAFIMALGFSTVQAQLTPGSQCSDGLCVGQVALDKLNNYRQVQIVQIQNNGKYVLRLMDNGMLLRDRTRINLAFMTGCADGLCVGLVALDKSNNFRQVQIYAIQNDGKYVLRIIDNGFLLGDRTRVNLAYLTGCSNGWCVGQIAYDRNNNYRQVRVIAIQNDSKYVIQYTDNGYVMGDRTQATLVLNPTYPGNSNRVIYGAGINTTTSPNNACLQRYGTYGLSVEIRNRMYACTYETCGHPSVWSRVFCQ